MRKMRLNMHDVTLLRSKTLSALTQYSRPPCILLCARSFLYNLPNACANEEDQGKSVVLSCCYCVLLSSASFTLALLVAKPSMLVPDPPGPGPGCAQPSTGRCTVAPACMQYVQAFLAVTVYKREPSTCS